MPQPDFSRFHYFPSLQSSPEEILAYTQLSDHVKDNIIPIFELSIQMRGDGWQLSETQIRAAVPARAFIVDLCKAPAPRPYLSSNPTHDDIDRYERLRVFERTYNDYIDELLTPHDGFANWRELTARIPNAVPTVVYGDPRTQSRQIIRQASLLSRGTNSIAIRVTEAFEVELCAIIPQIINVLDSSSQLLIIADCDYGRQNIARRSRFATRVMQRVTAGLETSEAAGIQAVCLSSSFSRPQTEDVTTLVSQDWRLWRIARQSFAFRYGDFGSMARLNQTNTFIPGTWTAAVNIPTNESWVTFRSPNNNDPDGWIQGARILSGHAEFGAVPDCWGKQKITQAAGGILTDIDRAARWRAVRINMHITMQAVYAEQVITNYTPNPED